MPERIKLTVHMDKELHRIIRHEAIEKDTTIREIVDEAVRQWLERERQKEAVAQR